MSLSSTHVATIQNNTAKADSSLSAFVRDDITTSPGQDYPRGAQPALNLESVHFSYQEEKPILKGVDLTIKEGEYLVILGHNGSGKSTCARHFNALLTPNKGRVLVFGQDSSEEENKRPIRSQVGMIFQHPDDQMVTSVVRDDIAFGPENLSVPTPQIIERVEAALHKVGMQAYAEADPSELSGGQKQRIAIAGILAMRPKLIVFDEAGAMLDPRGRSSLLKVMRELHEQGLTIINITHFMEDALEASRVIVMNEGRIALEGSAEEIFSQHSYLSSLGLELPFEAELRHQLKEAGIILGSGKNLAQEIASASLADKAALPAPASVSAQKARRPELATNTPMEDHPLIFKDVFYSYKNVFQKKKRKKQQESSTANYALKQINLKIKAGSFVGLIGHTGSGKSTLIEHMNGLKVPHSGEVLVQGRSTTDKPGRRAARKVVGYVSQYPEYQLFAETVFEDIAFGPRNLGMPEELVEKTVRAAMELLGLDYEQMKELSPFALSGGQQRRAAIAGILAMEPRILILDEPLAGLDPVGRQDILRIISTLHKQGCTIVMVSHSMNEIAELADHLIVMNEGQIALQGRPDQVFMAPETLRRIGLDIPEVSKLYFELKEVGITLEHFPYRQDDFIEALKHHLLKDQVKHGI